MEIARTILEQLGGKRFQMMTGAKDFLALDNGLKFRLPGGGGHCRNGINCVKITLDPSDTYSMEFGKIRGYDYTKLTGFSDIYDDQLQEVFTQETGLETHF